MSVVAMKITKAEKHPQADRLRLYEAEAGETKVVFVANLTNVYEVDDVVAVAQVGTRLILDGSKLIIQPTLIRNVESHGMGLGKTIHPVGCNLDSLFPWPVGTPVRTTRPEVPTTGWTEEGIAKRRFDVDGTIEEHHTGHGFCYTVKHQDGTRASYEPQELILL